MHRIIILGLLFLETTTAYVTVTKYTIGNKTYYEKFEQPWFRHMHYDHDPVEASEKEESAFGKHYVPEDDVFIAPDWTAHEAKYMGCLNRTCVCGYFKGSLCYWNFIISLFLFLGNVKDEECYLPSGKILKRAVRRELRSLKDEDRIMIENAWNAMKKSGLYNKIGRVHKYSGVHSGPAFTLWHREFLKRLELALRDHMKNPDFGLPFWDSTLDSLLPEPKDSIIFSELFLGEVDDKGFVKNGPYHNWETMEGRAQIFRNFGEDDSGEMLNDARVDWLINNPDINMILGATMPLTTCPMNHTLDARMLEFSHDYVHFFVNGDMSKSYSSSNDVCFVYHHGMIDWIFETWRQNMQTREERETQYPKSDERCFPFWHNGDNSMPLLQVLNSSCFNSYIISEIMSQPHKNKDALSNGYTDFMYEYYPRSTCSKDKPDCHSPYLFCYIPPNDEHPPSCVSKVRRNGVCKGFEDWPICYWGKCVDGKCDEKAKPKKELEKFKKFEKKLVPFIM
ncbi:CRE-TYR-5 protein [Caenorhabditis remanei]|uniref:CRE-TYR-5 protein n=1 Tax=Caenorhabditis remanei TaxID=31234 RepID=E3LM42_CAERE|nr:CRE-TYR-5 protein [Caenorhabditis remanei]